VFSEVMSSNVKPRSRLGCNGCKKLKTKCDELKPTCSRCEKRRIPCIYSFEMIFQNQNLIERKSKLIIKDLELLRNDEKRIQRLALLKLTNPNFSTITNDQIDINKPDNTRADEKPLKERKNIKFKDDDKNESLSFNNNGSIADTNDSNYDINQTDGLETDETYLSYKMVSFIPLSQIPILPLPDNLLDHPYYRDAFDFYKHFTAHFVVASTPQLYKNNPMHKIIPKYAIENKCLMDVIVSLALTHRSTVLTDENFNPQTVELLISRSLVRLLDSINASNNGLQNEVACITALFMCTQKIFSGENANKYKEIIDLARNSFEGFVEINPNISKLSSGKYLLSEEENPFLYFLLNWIGYLEIIGMMMAISPTDFKMPYRPNPVFQNFEIKRQHKIDLFLGFDIDFLIIFDKLIPILNSVEESHMDEDSISTEILSQAIEWEHEFNDAYANFKSAKANLNDPTENEKILNSTNDLFYYAGILHLYRRIYKIPRSNSVVQRMVRKIYEIFKNDIESASSAENCSIFPLFIAACESLTEEHRSFFFSRFQIQFVGGNSPAGDVLKILTDTWDTGEAWVNSVKRVRKESGFFLI
jgi:hypothetical protein